MLLSGGIEVMSQGILCVRGKNLYLACFQHSVLELYTPSHSLSFSVSAPHYWLMVFAPFKTRKKKKNVSFALFSVASWEALPLTFSFSFLMEEKGICWNWIYVCWRWCSIGWIRRGLSTTHGKVKEGEAKNFIELRKKVFGSGNDSGV